MKIVAPLRHIKELEMLLHYGADEIYCGIQTPEWEEKYGDGCWMNRRDPKMANISSIEDLKRVTQGAHAAGVSVHIALNAPYYSKSGLDYVLELCSRLVEEAGVDGLIIGDLILLTRLSESKLPVRLHLSSLGSCFNSESIGYYQSLGVKRVILPRQLTVSDIYHLKRKSDPRMEFEVFAVNDGCFYEEGFCQTTHALGAFCLTDWEVSERGGKRPPSTRLDMKRGLNRFREYLWFQNNCGSSYQENGLPNGPCSLCWFGQFRDWGITAVKIVGREASFIRKMGSLQLVKAVMDKVQQNLPAAEIVEYARSVRNTPDYCDHGAMCYFKEF